MRTSHAMDLLEAAYRLDGDTQDWLRGLATVAKAFSPTHIGAGARLVNMQGGAVEGLFVVDSPFEDFLEKTLAAEKLAFTTPEFQQRSIELFSRLSATTTSQIFRSVDVSAMLAQLCFPVPMKDAFHITAPSDRGTTVVISTALPAARRLSAAGRAVWERVAVHIGAAIRLRLALTTHPSNRPMVTLDARTMKVVDCSVQGVTGSARDSLRRAAIDVDRARTSAVRSDARAALELWRGLFDGRWSIIERYESDGRRLLVAHENQPMVAADRRLTRRERQVVRSIGSGNTEGLTAYTLGLSISTVRTHLARALRKLGLAHRAQLVEVALQLGATEP